MWTISDDFNAGANSTKVTIYRKFPTRLSKVQHQNYRLKTTSFFADFDE